MSFLDPRMVEARKSQFIVAGRNASSPAPRASARAASEGASSDLLGRIYACQCDLENFIDFLAHEKPNASNAAKCVLDLETRLTAYEEANKNDRRPNFTAKPDADLSTRVSNIESSILTILLYLRQQAFDPLGAKESHRNYKPMKDGATDFPHGSGASRSNLSGRGRELDRLMGLAKSEASVKMVGNTLELGVMSPEQGRKFLGGRK